MTSKNFDDVIRTCILILVKICKKKFAKISSKFWKSISTGQIGQKIHTGLCMGKKWGSRIWKFQKYQMGASLEQKMIFFVIDLVSTMATCLKLVNDQNRLLKDQ